ncbi:MAG TPA: hypothetical protein VE956_17070 [Nodularia sp. (in: cyanobacteria)]|nr:hypothetical protein [Nodularia sp. (in: cyanobacteria)]
MKNSCVDPPVIINFDKLFEKFLVGITALNSRVIFDDSEFTRFVWLSDWYLWMIGDIPPSQADKQEILEVLAPDHAHRRLACWVHVTGNVEIRRI